MPGESDRDQSIEQLLRRGLRGAPAQTPTPCLDAETLAAWADRTLSSHEAAQVEHHMADCARCQVMAAVFARIEPVQPGTVAWWRRPTLRWALPLGMGVAAAAVLLWVELPRTDQSPAATETMARAEAPAVAPPPSAAPQTDRFASADSALAPQRKPTTRSATGTGQARPSSRPVASQPPVREIDAIAPPAPERTAPAAAPRPASTPPVPTPFPGVQQQTPPPPPAPSPERTNAAAAAYAQGRDAFGRLAMLPPPVVVSEFVGVDQDPAARPVAVGGQGRGGAGGGVGRGATAAESGPRALSASPGPIRWRILANGSVERLAPGSASWEPVAIDPPAFITDGNAPTSTVCWLVGRDGLVLRSTDGLRFTRLNVPDPADLIAVRASDAAHATVTTVNGRVFTTLDGGLSWQLGGAGL